METRIIFCLVSILMLVSCEKEQQLSLPGKQIAGNWTEVEQAALQKAIAPINGKIDSIDRFTTPLSQSIRHCIYLKKLTTSTPDQVRV